MCRLNGLNVLILVWCSSFRFWVIKLLKIIKGTSEAIKANLFQKKNVLVLV